MYETQTKNAVNEPVEDGGIWNAAGAERFDLDNGLNDVGMFWRVDKCLPYSFFFVCSLHA